MSGRPSAPSELLGFLVVEQTQSGDGYIAAIMVADQRGYPLEFRATTPIRPTLVQRTLYGKSLEHYVAVELCGTTLLRQTSRKPRALVVPKVDLLDLADEAEIPIIALWRAGEALRLEDETIPQSRGVVKASTGTPPLIYEGRFADAEAQRDGISFLQDCANHFDPIEAFDRMRSALQLLAKEDSRYA